MKYDHETRVLKKKKKNRKKKKNKKRIKRGYKIAKYIILKGSNNTNLISNKSVPSVIMVLLEQSQKGTQTHLPCGGCVSGELCSCVSGGGGDVRTRGSGGGAGNNVCKVFLSVIVFSLFLSVVGTGNMGFSPA